MMISKIAWKKAMAVICSTALVGTAMCGLGHKVTYAEGTTSEFDGDQGTLPWNEEFDENETENNGDEGTFPWNDEFTTTAPETTVVVTTKGNGDNWGEDIFTTEHQETTTEAEATTVPETTEKEVTTAKVETTIDGAAVYTGNSQATPVIKKAIKKKSAKKATIKLRKVIGVNGYQVKVSVNKKFKKKATVTVASNKASIVVKKLKAGKKYFVKARTYTIVNGKKVYGKWSKVKKIKNK